MERHGAPPRASLGLAEWWESILTELGENPSEYRVACYTAVSGGNAEVLGGGPKTIRMLNVRYNHFEPLWLPGLRRDGPRCEEGKARSEADENTEDKEQEEGGQNGGNEENKGARESGGVHGGVGGNVQNLAKRHFSKHPEKPKGVLVKEAVEMCKSANAGDRADVESAVERSYDEWMRARARGKAEREHATLKRLEATVGREVKGDTEHRRPSAYNAAQMYMRDEPDSTEQQMSSHLSGIWPTRWTAENDKSAKKGRETSLRQTTKTRKPDGGTHGA